MLVSTNTFLRRVCERTGLDAERCGALVEDTLVVIGGQLHTDARRALTDNLPPTLAGWAEAAPRDTQRSLEHLLHAGRAHAHVAEVCGAVAELLPLDVLVAVRGGVQRELAALLFPHELAPEDLSSWRAR